MVSNNIVLLNYTILETIGKGAFGNVYKGINNQNNTIVALKVENLTTSSRLIFEYKIYKKLLKKNNCKGIPIVYTLLQTTNYNIMVMQLLGESLEDIFNKNNKLFSISTVLFLGVQILSILENIHNCGYLHRDIKPNNFLVDHNNKYNVYLTDFGLSKSFIDINNNHIKETHNHDIIGTARYSSINMHKGIEPSRRDDLESVGYMLIYFLKGKLPWQGTQNNTHKKDIFNKIGEIKCYTKIEALCENYPKCFCDYLYYCRNLKFQETPNYNYLKNLFLNEIISNKYICHYEWCD